MDKTCLKLGEGKKFSPAQHLEDCSRV